MNISGVLVVSRPEQINDVIGALRSLEGVEVHHNDPATGRIVVTLEAETIPQEVEGLRRIKALPNVTLAEMSHHYFEEDREIIENIPSDLDGEAPLKVPAFLND